MPNIEASSITIPVVVEGTPVPTTIYFKDAAARQMIEDLGNVLYWIGVTTTVLEDNVTTSPDVVVDGVTVTAKKGGIAQYNGEEFAYSGTKWQSLGKNNFGALAFKSSASGSYTPNGSVSAPNISVTGGSTTTVNSITNVGTLPTFSLSGETLVYTEGTLPTKGADVSVVNSTGTISASAPTFTGTESTVTVS